RAPPRRRGQGVRSAPQARRGSTGARDAFRMRLPCGEAYRAPRLGATLHQTAWGTYTPRTGLRLALSCQCASTRRRPIEEGPGEGHAHGVDRGAPRTTPGPPGATDRAISPTPATRPGPRPPRPDETGRRPALLSRRNRPPGPRAARAPGGRFELVATVEAGGIEPPSEGASAIASTCVACALLSPRSLPQAGSRAASRRCVSAPAPPAVAGTQPEVMTLEPALRAQAGRAWRPN